MTDPRYVAYHPDIEKPTDNEEKLFDEMANKLRANNEKAYRKHKRGLRDAHAKSHGILRGELEVLPDLPPELAQGFFATPGTYPVITRLSTTSGVIRSDQIRGVRGLGIKVIGVDPENKTLPDDHEVTQDFIMVTHREFLFPDAEAYLKKGIPLAILLANLSDTMINVLSEGLALVNKLIPLRPTLAVFVRPNTHILGDTFYSSAPLRYGDYVARMLYAPRSPEVRALAGQSAAHYPGVNALQDMVVDFFGEHDAEYELRVQLCTDLRTMPIEDATVDWSEEASPHRTVAVIRFPKQDPYTPERRAYGDDILSFNSWRCIREHRPLGSINRLKRKVYDASSQFRHSVNNAPIREPRSAADLPD
ncbi:catalase family protein [Gordonia insulae]|uniref:Catalase n=1 Tax=Gordonia insulae TaxID=2420509 RepID=A0A3G8JHI7_9ACTN|nr:catalase family protein [Gordonia insulae]AZG44463.1 hypothetical protein D7316_01049 [Gordonia insulae]